MTNTDHSSTLADIEHSSVPLDTLIEILEMSQDDAVKMLKTVLRFAIKLEMTTIPIYLYTYYSICRKPGQDQPPTGSSVSADKAFPHASSLFGNQAGATIMSVAVEEMLHMSLAMNLLTSMLDKDECLPQIYDGLKFGDNGIVLPALDTLKVNTGGTVNNSIEKITKKPLEIPLAKLSLDQLQHFMRIEYPAIKDSIAEASDTDKAVHPDNPDWATIGEVYDYAKALIQFGNDDGNKMSDSVFAKSNGTQIGSDNYSASSIDTLSSGSKSFTFENPPVVGTDNTPSAVAASTVAKFENDDNHDYDSKHSNALFRIATAADAITAINTICEQGEGSDFTKYVEDNELEESHYYKFWSLCAHLDGYPAKMTTPPQVKGISAPTATTNQIRDIDQRFVYNFPTNPKVACYADDRSKALVNVANGLFQYMLIMTETTLLVPDPHQKLYFNKTMHQSMIWVMDKFYQAMRHTKDCDGTMVVPTFENPFPQSMPRKSAFEELNALAHQCTNFCEGWPEFDNHVKPYMETIENLPDVSSFWKGDTGHPPRASRFSYLSGYVTCHSATIACWDCSNGADDWSL